MVLKRGKDLLIERLVRENDSDPNTDTSIIIQAIRSALQSEKKCEDSDLKLEVSTKGDTFNVRLSSYELSALLWSKIEFDRTKINGSIPNRDVNSEKPYDGKKEYKKIGRQIFELFNFKGNLMDNKYGQKEKT